MSFLHPSLLWALPAVLLPLIIHLLHRRRFQAKSWGAMQFLREALEERRGQRKLKHWLLLGCRMLIIAALILAMSRPLVGGWLAGWFGGGDRTIAIVLDRSASMERRLPPSALPKRELALQRITQAFTALRPTEIWVHDSASGDAIPYQEGHALAGHLEATDTTSDIPGLLKRFMAHWEQTQQSSGECWIVSDLQSTDWRPDHVGEWADVEAAYRDLTHPPKIRVLALRGGQSNRSIRCRVEDNALIVLIQEDSGSQIPGTILDSDTPSTIPLTLTIDGQQTVHQVGLTGQSTTELALPLPGQAPFTGSVTLPDDGNSRDNEAFFAVAPKSPPRVILACESTEVAHLLNLAVAPWPSGTPGQAQVESKGPAGASADRWFGADGALPSLVIWQGELPSATVASRLEAYVAEGGQLLFFPSTRATANNQHTLGEVRFGATASQQETPLPISSWAQDHGPLRNTNTGEPLPLSHWGTKQYVTLTPPPHAEFHATYPNGDPALLGLAHDRGNIYVCATLPLEEWSSLDEGLVLVPLIQRLIATGLQQQSPVRHQAPQREPWHAGAWVRGDADNDSQTWEVAVRPAGEDLASSLTDEQLNHVLGQIPFKQFSLASNPNENESVSDWWRVFFVLALAFLVAESLLTLTPRRRPTMAEPAS